MADFSGGHITTEEASQLIDTLNAELGSDTLPILPRCQLSPLSGVARRAARHQS